ncbi:MAG: preprotein translocase subunit YajC [Caulobacterales bacterium]
MTLTPALILAVAAPAAGAGGIQDMLVQFAPLLLIGVLFYMLILRPQQQRQKDHLTRVNAVKRGDVVVMSNGMIGKVVRVEDAEVGVEIAQNVTVKVLKHMLHEVRGKTEPAAANDSKS